MQILDLKNTTLESVIDQTIGVLQNGGLVIFPTETTYGAGVDATNQSAVDKLLAYKSRREGKPLSIAVNSIKMAEQYVELNESAKQLYEQFLPGPLTVISQSLNQVAQGVESEFGTLGVRIPDYDLILKLIAQFGRPLTATSANMSDGARPYSIAKLLSQLPQKQQNLIDLILDAGELPQNEPSTIIDTTLSTPVVFRSGVINTQYQEPKTKNQKLRTKHQAQISSSTAETKSIAGKLLLKHWDQIKDTGLIIGLNGSLGTGKTIFAQGVAEFLQIKDPVTSPTYSYINEYDFTRHQTSGKLFHLDLWKINSAAEFKLLKINELIGQNQILVVEWFEQIKKFWAEENLPQPDLQIEIREIDQTKRELKILDLSS